MAMIPRILHPHIDGAFPAHVCLVGSVLHQLVLDPLAHPLAVAATIALAVTLSVLYLRFRRLAF